MSNTLRAIFWGGALCALLDFICVTLLYALKGIHPVQVWQAVASSVLGPVSFQRGWSSGALGLALHCAVSLTAATCFVLASRQVPVLARQYILFGPVYGILVFLVMNLIVVPLSAMPKLPPPGASVIVTQIVIHIILIGLPISASAYRFLK